MAHQISGITLLINQLRSPGRFTSATLKEIPSIGLLTVSTIPGASGQDYATNGTKGTYCSGLAYNTTYKVYVNATDIGSGGYTRRWYQFTTKEDTSPSSPTVIHPANNAPYESVYNQYLKVHVTDSDGDTMNVSFYWSNGTLIHTLTGIADDSDANLSLLPYIAPDWLQHKNQRPTGYAWYVNVNRWNQIYSQPNMVLQ